MDAHPLEGELGFSPSSRWAAAAWALSGAWFVRGAVRLVAKVALAYRTPAKLWLSERGLELTHRTELLGRVLSDRSTLVPLGSLSAVTREVRYGRAGLYAGLLALVLGTYVGTGLLVDGIRVPGGSPSLLGLGLLAILVGILLDFGLTVATDVARKTCRVIIEPDRGHGYCVQGLDPAAVDALLADLARAASAPAESQPAPHVAAAP